MPATLEPPTDLLKAAAALDPDRFEQLVAGLLRVRAERVARTVQPDEAALLTRINTGPSPDVWGEYRRLCECRAQGTLSPAEQKELIQLTDVVEQYQADRAAALVELASVRGQPLDQLMQTLGITGPTPE